MNQNGFKRFAGDVSSVMAMRLAALPLWWVIDPAKAEKETKKMFSEKENAFVSMQQQMVLAPTMFWFDLWRGMLSGDRDGGLGRARASAERRITSPYRSRVSGNKRRLSKGG